MKFNRFYNSEMMNMSASAPCANAGTSCAQSAEASSMIMILDAIIMASIIIYGLSTILRLRLFSLLAILVLVGLVVSKIKTSWCYELAI